ncbi:MAG: hypothetical protein AB8F78_07845 [Saprospiraceae bacterium]
MSNPTNEFHELWQAGDEGDAMNGEQVRLNIMQRARDPKQESIQAQVLTIVILSIVVLVLLLFFHYLSPVEEQLSIIGKWLMIGSMLLRIAAELIGLSLARKIDFFESAAMFVQESRRLVGFRAGVHQNLVIISFALYSIGYYMLMPEWITYFSSAVIWLLCISFPVIMTVVIVLFIWPGMKREKVALLELEKLAEALEKA